MKFHDLPDVLTVAEAAKFLRIGKEKIYNLLQKGAISHVRVGTKYLIPKQSLLAFLTQTSYAEPTRF